ncbi:DUF4157 domain-containing protein [Ideonella sp.]|uniref:eCIS core domain-containing protein n=1 Tax=Ideonella sp. TaxID=1929293 RepID=UPI0035B1649C
MQHAPPIQRQAPAARGAPVTARLAKLLVRPKLKLGGAHDEAERHADRVAAKALATAAKAAAPAAPATPAAPAKRTGSAAHAAPGPLVEPAHDERRGELWRELDARVDEDRGMALDPGLASRIAALQAGGAPLPAAVRREMEAGFGIDLSSVRVHTGAEANVLAEQLHAHAFTVGEHIAFNRGAFAPQSGAGRHLLAHELAHVAQHRASQGALVPADAAPVRRETREDPGFFSSLFDGAGRFLANQGWRVLRRYAPRLEPIVREGPVNWLKGQLSRVFDGLTGALNRLNPAGAIDTLSSVFGGLVARAQPIIAALASGDCEPLFQAVRELRTFLADTAGAAWARLTEFLQPVGDFFSRIWAGYGAPAVQWLQETAGDVWGWLQELGRDIWDWTQPVREDLGAAWDWIKEQLFGTEPTDANAGENREGLIGWISRKAGEAWDAIKEQTRPVWQPVANVAERVAALIPPPFVARMGEQMQQLAGQLGDTASQMESQSGGRPVAENRQAIASALPSVMQVITGVRGLIVDAGQWLGDRLGELATGIGDWMGRLRASPLLSLLANALGWLQGAAQRLLAWAREQVGALFNWLVQGFDRLTPFFRTVLETVNRLIGVVTDLMMLPQLVLSGVWRLIPACIRDPVRDFLFTQILSRIPVFGAFFSNPELWQRVQETALEILRQAFVDGNLARAAWTFFQAVLRVMGLPPELVVRILAKAAQAIGDVLANPLAFLGNLLRAMRAGFGRFFDNVGTHLLNGIAAWLFGAAREAGIEPPADFSLRGVLGFVLQVLGVTVDNVFRRLAERVGQGVADRLRQMLDVATGVWSFVSILVTEGPAGLWREVQQRLSNLWDSVVQGVIGWVTERIITVATRWLLSLLDVTGIMPIVNALIAIYNAIESFIQYLRELLEIVSTVLDGVLGIARGQIDQAAGFLEGALARALPVAIGFLANQFGFGRIAHRLAEILGALRERVDAAIDWVIDRAIRLGQSVIDLARRGAAALRDWWRARVAFRSSNGERHQMYFRGDGRQAALILESDPEPFRDFVARQPDSADKTEALRLYDLLRQKQDEAVSAGAASGGARHTAAPAAGSAAAAPAAQIEALLNDLSVVTARLLGSAPASGERPAWGPPATDSYGSDVSAPVITRAALGVWPRGSTPSDSTATLRAWRRLIKRRNDQTGASSYYVRGHLLNHNIGGPGDDWKNLTPLAQESNNRAADSMLYRFERPVKDAVDANSTVRNFHVRPTYGSTDRSGQIAQIDTEIAVANRTSTAPRRAPGRTVAELQAIRDVVETEQHVATSITCSAVIERANGARQALNEVIDNRPTLTQGEDWTRYKVNVSA